MKKVKFKGETWKKGYEVGFEEGYATAVRLYKPYMIKILNESLEEIVFKRNKKVK